MPDNAHSNATDAIAVQERMRIGKKSWNRPRPLGEVKPNVLVLTKISWSIRPSDNGTKTTLG